MTFRLEATTPGYVRVDHRLMKRLLGDFAPTRGALVFSKTGELLGIMVSTDFCVPVTNVRPPRSIRPGGDIKAQETCRRLDDMVARYRALPFRLP